MSLRAFVSCLLVASTAAPAFAMSMRTQLEAMAFSEDGRSVLVRAELDGPEGGRMVSYEIWSAEAPHRTHADVSSNLSNGAGPTPEKIDTATCTQALRTLGDALKKRGFKGVTAHPERCAKRDGLVTAEARHAAEVTGARFHAKGNQLSREGLEARFMGAEINFVRDERKECTLKQPKRDTPATLGVWGSKQNRLVYVVETTASGDQGLLGMCAVDAEGKLHALPTSVEK